MSQKQSRCGCVRDRILLAVLEYGFNHSGQEFGVEIHLLFVESEMDEE